MNASPALRLTRRRFEAVCLVAEEALSNAEIAQRLNISKQCAKNYLTRAYAVIGCHSRHELILRWHSGLKEELTARVIAQAMARRRNRKSIPSHGHRVSGFGLCDNCVHADHFSCDAPHCNCICNELLSEVFHVSQPQSRQPQPLCA